jgi:ribosomal protein L40E
LPWCAAKHFNLQPIAQSQVTKIPYCPRCGLEVGAEASKCPRCGTEIPRVSEAERPERTGAVEHLKYAADVARRNPKVFIPGAIGAVFSLLSGYMVESWDVYQDFMAYLWKLFEAQAGMSPVAYASGLFDYTRLFGLVPVAVLILGLLSWASYLASIHLSWNILRGEKGDVQSSYRYIARNLWRFMVASLWTALFSFLVGGVYVVLIVGSDSVGFEAAFWMGLLFTVALIVAVFLAGPVYVVMVGEDMVFMEALRLTVGFTRRRAMSYLGITIFIFISLMGLGMIPWIGLYLSFVTGALENLAVSDLYTQYKRQAVW